MKRSADPLASLADVPAIREAAQALIEAVANESARRALEGLRDLERIGTREARPWE